MPAHLFEFIYVYIYLKNKFGKPPTNVSLCEFLEIDNCTGLQRKNRCIDLGFIADPGYSPKGKDWLQLTDRGAEAFMAVLDGIEPVMITDGTFCSEKREIFPDGIKYSYAKYKQYREYMKALSTHGHADPT